jgi:hypothetical protein
MFGEIVGGWGLTENCMYIALVHHDFNSGVCLLEAVPLLVLNAGEIILTHFC